MTQDVAAARADLERLAKLADAATPGPWMPTVGHPSGRFYGVHTADGPIVRFNGIAKGSTAGHANAAFIAAANPATIKALLARVTALEDRNEGLEEDLRDAVQTAYNRGATEWARLNYPQWAEWLDSQKGCGT